MYMEPLYWPKYYYDYNYASELNSPWSTVVF